MDSGRRSSPGVPRSPRLQRSRSGGPSSYRTSTPDIHPQSPNPSHNFINRSKSTDKSRKNKYDENRSPIVQEPVKKNDIHRSFRKPQEKGENLAGVFHRQRISDAAKTEEMVKVKKRRSCTSPSAWALSPGRSPLLYPLPEMLKPGSEKKKSGGMSGVLKFFRQQKKPEFPKDPIHQLRILQTRYVQWRFVNARAEAAFVRRKSFAEKKLFNAWLVVSKLRNSVMEKKIQLQKLKQEMKLIQILNSQIQFLEEWEKIDKKSFEAVAKSARVLGATSLKVPLVEGAKADIFSLYPTFCAAIDVMNGIEETLARFFTQVEKINSLLTELVKTEKLEREGMDELMNTVEVVASMEAKERSLRVHLIQAMKERDFCQQYLFVNL